MTQIVHAFHDSNLNVTALPWFAVHVRPCAEGIVSKVLSLKGYETYLPTYKVVRRWCDRNKEVELPLFTGYLFCRIDLARRLPVLITSGVVEILGVGKVPVPIPDSEIAAIETALRSGLPIRPHPYLSEGDNIVITEGPLRNLQGFLITNKNSSRVIVNISLLQRAVSVELERGWVTARRGPRPEIYVDGARGAVAQRCES